MKILSKKIKNSKLRLIAIVLAIVVLLIAAAVMMLLQTPARYKPASPENADKISPYLTNYLAQEIYNNVQMDEAFDLLVTQEGLNDIIARKVWGPKLYSGDSGGASVVFENGTIYLMIKINWGCLPVVMTAIAAPRIDDNGKVRLNVDTIKAGAVDITWVLTTEEEEALLEDMEHAGKRDWSTKISDGVFRNTPIEAVFEVSAHKKHVRLTAIKIQKGLLTLTLKPQ